jgi:ABC-2 type transport system permease protein
VFAGAAKLSLYTIVPAAFVASVPARLLRHFELRWALALVGAALASALAGWAVFTRGLRRYTSGSVWVRA